MVATPVMADEFFAIFPAARIIGIFQSRGDDLQVLVSRKRIAAASPREFGAGGMSLQLFLCSVASDEALVSEIRRKPKIAAIRVPTAVEVDCFSDLGIYLREGEFRHRLEHDAAFRSVSFGQVGLRSGRSDIGQSLKNQSRFQLFLGTVVPGLFSQRARKSLP